MKTYKIPFLKYNTAVYQYGKLDNKHPVVIILHGGPGGNHNMVLPLTGLSNYGFTVITYDQLGSLNSSHIKGKTKLFKIETFVNELDNLIKKLKLKKYHIIGHSWGGMLAMEYILRKKPKGLDKLVLFSSLASTTTWNETNYRKCLRYLTPNLRKEFTRAYLMHDEKILNKFYKKYLRPRYRVKTNTSPFSKIRHKKDAGDEIYQYMWGKVDEFGTGLLLRWNITKKIKNIKNPTLILHGKYDQSTREMNEVIHQQIKGSQLVYLSKSSHIGYYNEYPKVMNEISKFLNEK